MNSSALRSGNVFIKTTRKPKKSSLVLLKRDFFARHSVDVAANLIGKLFVVTDSKTKKRFVTRIIETEAYRTDDRASHCSRGWTKRSAPMFETPGHAYVYFIYGMYVMVNFVTEPSGTPGAVLIRGLEPVSGFESHDHHLLNGPGKLCRALGIEMQDNRVNLLRGRFKVYDDGVKPESITVTPRVGIREEEPYKPWRFFWSDHSCVSRSKENKMILEQRTTAKKSR